MKRAAILALVLLHTSLMAQAAGPKHSRAKANPSPKLESKSVGLYHADEEDSPLRLLIRANHTFAEFGFDPVETPTTEANGTKGTWKLKGNLLTLSGNESGLKIHFDGKNLLKRVQDDPNIELPDYVRVK